MPPKLFTFTHFPRNTPANPFVSRTFKTKDLKPFRFTHLQKSGRGSPHLATVVIPLALRHEGSEPAIFAGDEGSQRSQSPEPQPANHKSPVTNHESLRLTPLTSTLAKFAPATPLDSALTSKRAAKSFTCNTYEKHTGGEGGWSAAARRRLARDNNGGRVAFSNIQPQTDHPTRKVVPSERSESRESPPSNLRRWMLN
jgi:hypothetical protein